jgi:hypothetical protein
VSPRTAFLPLSFRAAITPPEFKEEPAVVNQSVASSNPIQGAGYFAAENVTRKLTPLSSQNRSRRAAFFPRFSQGFTL